MKGKRVGIVETLLRRLSRRFIYERKAPRRRPASVPTRFRIRSGARASEYVEAHTRDLSASGLALETPVIRIGDLHAYTSMDMVTPTRLDIVIGIPSGEVTIVGETVRYDKMAESVYLLGVHIVEMSHEDRERYESFVESLRRR